MSKVYVIGDCQTARVYSHHLLENAGRNFIKPATWTDDKTIKDTDIELRMWGLSGYKCWDADFSKDHNEGTMSSPTEDVPDLAPITDNLMEMLPFSSIKGSDIIMPWMGYIDCRNYLPKYNNAEEVVKNYVEETLRFFDGTNVRFIEPFPQFDVLGTHNYLEAYSYEVKAHQSNMFIELLHQYSDKAGLMPPVSQSIVYDAVGEKRLTKKHAKQGGEYHDFTLLDGLKPEYNKKVYFNLIKEIQRAVDILL